MADATPNAPPDDASERHIARVALRWKRISLVFVSVVAVAFIAISVLQIIPDVFGAWVHPIVASTPGSPPRICADGVLTLARALDRAKDAAGGPGFDRALQPEWNAASGIEQACARSSEGLDAWAALLRLRRAEEQLAGSPGDPLAPLQREVASHLPADLR